MAGRTVEASYTPGLRYAMNYDDKSSVDLRASRRDSVSYFSVSARRVEHQDVCFLDVIAGSALP